MHVLTVDIESCVKKMDNIICPKCGGKMFLDLSHNKVREYKCSSCGKIVEYWYMLKQEEKRDEHGKQR